jgi:hypothetical protein
MIFLYYIISSASTDTIMSDDDKFVKNAVSRGRALFVISCIDETRRALANQNALKKIDTIKNAIFDVVNDNAALLFPGIIDSLMSEKKETASDVDVLEIVRIASQWNAMKKITERSHQVCYALLKEKERVSSTDEGPSLKQLTVYASQFEDLSKLATFEFSAAAKWKKNYTVLTSIQSFDADRRIAYYSDLIYSEVVEHWAVHRQLLQENIDSFLKQDNALTDMAITAVSKTIKAYAHEQGLQSFQPRNDSPSPSYSN